MTFERHVGMGKLKTLLLTIALAALTLGGCAADGDASAPSESPTAVPNMEGETQPTTGAAATEQ